MTQYDGTGKTFFKHGPIKPHWKALIRACRQSIRIGLHDDGMIHKSVIVALCETAPIVTNNSIVELAYSYKILRHDEQSDMYCITDKGLVVITEEEIDDDIDGLPPERIEKASKVHEKANRRLSSRP